MLDSLDKVVKITIVWDCYDPRVIRLPIAYNVV